MSDALNAINEELQRLQQEGVDRVFIGESTLVLLKPVETTAAPKQSAPATTVVSDDLKQLVEGQSREKKQVHAPAPKTSSRGKPLPDTLPEFELPGGDAAAQLEWLKERVETCPTCNEHLSEDGKVVFGTGNAEAEIFFCGEAPGADEALKGEPFVGEAGQLLTKIMKAMGLDREDAYLTNILKWRPEHDKPYGNRPPTIEEMNFCLPYLNAQIEIIQPKVIIALGNTTVTGLLGVDPNRRMGSVRGTWQEFKDIPLMITFHPSYLLRAESESNPNAKKRLAWEDMLQVMEKVGLPISDKQRGFFLPKS